MKKHCHGTEPKEVLFLMDVFSVYQVTSLSQAFTNNQLPLCSLLENT